MPQQSQSEDDMDQTHSQYTVDMLCGQEMTCGVVSTVTVPILIIQGISVPQMKMWVVAQAEY